VWLRVGTFLAVWLSVVSCARSAAADDRALAPQARLQTVVDALRLLLEIPETVVATVVHADPLLLSVNPPAPSSSVFHLSADGPFLDTLTEHEIVAAVAHELGHVWVFTHHPYLQTEQLANEVAMRVVGRTSLERVYEKVWRRGGTKGDLAWFLGE
jgi:hypothetical protein